MKLAEVKVMSEIELLSAFYWLAVRTTHETNSKRGVTKQTQKEEVWILSELSSRFKIDGEQLFNMINK